MKNILRILIGLFSVLILVIIFKTITFSSKQIEVKPVTIPEFGKESLEHLSRAITFQTVSHEINMPIDTLSFTGLHQFLSEAYPNIHSKLKKEVFSEFSLLYTWEGKNPELKPVILMAHMDVVPAGEHDSWEKPPFSGDNDGTFIWGRGTLDDKGRMIAILESVEKLIGENFKPERTIYLAFGHDEEILGFNGARTIANTLSEMGVEAEFILDEGMVISKGIIPMIDIPAASIGISEKGYLSVSLSVNMDGGHSSTPEKETAVTVLNKAIYDITNHKTKANLKGPIKEFLRYTGPEMPFFPRMIFANQWLFKWLIIKIYEGTNTGNASIRTTITPTIFTAGIKDNVIPTKAEAVVNFRIIPGETSDDVLNHLEKVISDDRVKINVLSNIQESSPVSPTISAGFNIIHTTIKQVFPEVLVNPMLALGTTDSRHYAALSKNIYRFIPVTFVREDVTRMHGLNERIRIKDFKKSIGFHYQLVKNIK